jgi:TIR domain
MPIAAVLAGLTIVVGAGIFGWLLINGTVDEAGVIVLVGGLLGFVGASLFLANLRTARRSGPPRAPGQANVAAPRTPLDDDVQFTVYRPRRVRPERWYSMVAFAHKTTLVEMVPGAGLVDPVQEVDRQAQILLREEGSPIAKVVSDSSVPLSKGTELLFEPWLDFVDFNPPLVSLRWNEPVHHAQFRFSVPGRLDGRRLAGGLRVFVGVMLVGEVTFQIEVDSTTHYDAPPDQLAVNRYRKVFASYSHRDAAVVRAVADFGRLLGDDYYIDALTLRSGERWEQRLSELIDDADVFQLFWSTNAMGSAPVLREVEHALSLRREGFIRPVRWEEPLPTDERRGLPPAAVLELHFSWLPHLVRPVPPPDPSAMPPHGVQDPDVEPELKGAASPIRLVVVLAVVLVVAFVLVVLVVRLAMR